MAAVVPARLSNPAFVDTAVSSSRTRPQPGPALFSSLRCPMPLPFDTPLFAAPYPPPVDPQQHYALLVSGSLTSSGCPTEPLLPTRHTLHYPRVHPPPLQPAAFWLRPPSRPPSLLIRKTWPPGVLGLSLNALTAEIWFLPLVICRGREASFQVLAALNSCCTL